MTTTTAMPAMARAAGQAEPAALGPAPAEAGLVLGGMHCAACSGLIEAALLAVPGVERAEVSAAAQRATVRWWPQQTDLPALIQAVRAAGYDATPDQAAPARALRRREQRTALWRLFVAGFCAMQIMMFATPSYVAGPGELAPDLRQLLNWGSWLLTLPVLLFSAGPFFSGAWRALRKRRLGMDVPVALGIAVSFVASSGATFEPQGAWGAEVYFDSLSMFVSFLLAARYLEVRARHRAAEQLEAALGVMPETAERLRDDGTAESVESHVLQPGDRVRVALGASFPADGVLLQGNTQVDESLLTGESRPCPRAAGEAVVGGSVNLGAPVLLRVDRVGVDTRHGAVVALMRQALAQRPALVRQADAWAGPFLGLVLLLAALAAVAWSWIDPSRAVGVAVAVLIVTCPCALSLAVPSALVAAAGGLARRGVLLQRLEALDALARLDHLFIDKTGTLTEAQMACVGCEVVDATALAPVSHRRAAVGLARWSRHPLAQAVAALEPDALDDWCDVRETPGQGLEAVAADGTRWRLGSATWVADAPIVTPTRDDLSVAVFFGPVGRPLLRFDLDERLRADAAEAIAALRQDGVRLTLLSGDAPERAERMAARLGLTAAVGGATPETKLQALAEAQARGECAGMVGDGVNDAPVLARADVSFAMGRGAMLARVHADAVIVSNRLGDIVTTRRLAQRMQRVIRQNLAWSLAYNLACVPLALIGWLPPWAAGLGMACSSLAVVGNAMRLSRT